MSSKAAFPPHLTAGVLYVVATPIGNKEDITLRALRTLREVDLVAAEDTRHTGRFLAVHGIQNRLMSYHEHNESERTPRLVDKLLQGLSIALVSNAGTPSVSDPGYRLVNEAVARGIAVIPIPGVSAAITALSVAALPTDTFVFIGFPPRKQKQRGEMLEALAHEERTLVFYEAPRRIRTLLGEIRHSMGDRPAVLAREMTKLHEEYLRGRVSQIIDSLESRSSIKGECTLLITGKAEYPVVEPDKIVEALRQGLDNPAQRLSTLVKAVAEQYGLPRKQVYDAALRLKRLPTDEHDR
jgi:16S rRNA (cytidine1402-2'-O)-methyltransferase